MTNINSLDKNTLSALKRTLEAEFSRKHFKYFFKLIDKGNIIAPHHAIIIDVIQQFIDKKIKNLIISIPPQHGKFLKGDTPVLTTKGFKAHSDLQIGDYVYNDAGKAVAVLANSGLYDWHVNKVTFAGGEVLYAANEHLWKVHIEKDDKKGRRCMIIDTAKIASINHRRSLYVQSNKYKFFVESIQSHGIVSGNCIQVDGGMYLAGESLIPTHNSQIASRALPAYLLGLNPKARIIAASYNADNSAKFNRDVQRIIDSDAYKAIFPETTISAKAVRNDKDGAWLRNKDEFEIIKYGGFYKNAGIGGGITGRTADYAIIDDPVKGAADAASPTVRQSIYNWFQTDLNSRLNNKSQKLIIMTRWHEHDLVGTLLSNPKTAKHWHVLSLPAIREDMSDPRDPRQLGEALWEDFQGIDRLNEARDLGERYFRCLYQQDPKANKDILVYPDFDIIDYAFYRDIAKSEAYGLDFGYNDELALVGSKMVDKQLFWHEYIYQKGLGLDGLVEKMRAIGIRNELIVCDNASPANIEYLVKNGFNAVPCKKGAGSIFTGIQLVKTFRLSITNTSNNLVVEAQNYEWLTDAAGFATETPKGKKDHALDAGRYVTQKQVDLRGIRPARYIDTDIE